MKLKYININFEIVKEACNFVMFCHVFTLSFLNLKQLLPNTFVYFKMWLVSAEELYPEIFSIVFSIYDYNFF